MTVFMFEVLMVVFGNITDIILLMQIPPLKLLIVVGASRSESEFCSSAKSEVGFL